MGRVKPTIVCLDFDGVLHSYKSGWKGPRCIPDGPVIDPLSGRNVLQDLYGLVTTPGIEVHIFSSRSRYLGARWAMKRWLRRQYVEICNATHIPEWAMKWICQQSAMDPWEIEVHDAVIDLVKKIKFPLYKPPAKVFVDDRAYRFQGILPGVSYIHGFKPWNKR